MKPKYWIDCPICNVQMKQRGQHRGGVWFFMCMLCDTVLEIVYDRPSDIKSDKRAKYRSERLEERRIK